MSLIRIDRQPGATIVRLARPPANAMNIALAEEALRIFDELAAEASGGPIVVTGEGRFFSAGIDLKEVPLYGPDEQRRLVGLVNRVFGALYGLPRPVIAAMNGHALGGGLVLALAADYRIAASGPSKIGLRELKVGVPFPVGALEVVRSALGARAARRIALLARDLDPAEALAEGAVDELREAEALLPRAIEVAGELGALPVESYGTTKRALRQEALARIAEAVESGRDPLLASWLSPATAPNARRVLEGR